MANSGELRRVEFGPSDLRRVRELVQAIASERLPDRVDDAVLAVHEVAVNSIVHGGGRAILSIHETPDSIVFTVDDEDGTGTVPLVGRISEEATSGRGLQIATLLSDHLIIDLGPSRTRVSVHMSRTL